MAIGEVKVDDLETSITISDDTQIQSLRPTNDGGLRRWKNISAHLYKDYFKTPSYAYDPINTDDIFIPVNGEFDSQGDKSIQKRISWNPWKAWKTASINGDLRFNRGEAGIFGEYENLWLDPAGVTWGTSTTVGDWYRLEGEGGGTPYCTSTSTTNLSKAVCSIHTKLGNHGAFLGEITIGGIQKRFTFSYSTGLITPIVGSFDSLHVKTIVAGSEYIITYKASEAPTGSDQMRIFPVDVPTAGLYNYFKDISYVGGIDYPVPYVKGIHLADSWVHPVNWNISTDWSIDIWFKPEGTDGYLFDTINSSLSTRILVSYLSGNLRIFTQAGGASSDILSTQPILGQHSNIKLVYISGTSLNAYLNGVLVGTILTNVPASSDLNPICALGSQQSLVTQLNGYFSDVMIRPSADVSTAHYASGLPWANLENLLHGEHGAYVDKFGHYVGESFTSMEEDTYSIVEQYTIGDQTVTKWSNGDMEIIGLVVFPSIALTSTSGSLFRNSSAGNITVTFIESFIEITTVIPTPIGISANLMSARPWVVSVDDFTNYAFSTISETSDLELYFIAKGKWK